MDDLGGESVDGCVHGVFVPLPVAGAALGCDARLMAEVDGQVLGVCRLAGGGYFRRKPGEAASLAVRALPDAEDRHSWHRLYWAARYAQAIALGHEPARGALRNELCEWLDDERRHGSESKAAYTVAERICSIAEVLFWTAGRPGCLPKELIIGLKRQARCDARHLALRCEYHLGVHNHLLNNARGLYAASALLPECGESAEWREAAFEIWDRFFPLLLLPDGTLAEQSSHYHLLLCRTALEYVLACRRAGRAMPAGLQERIAGMFRLADDLLRPDGTLPRFGDNSPDHVVEDLWGLLPVAWACGLLEEAPRHGAATLLTYYYGGAPPAADAAVSERTRLYESGGFGFLRSADGGSELAVHGSPRAEAGVHGDGGVGSYEFWSQGQVIIREPGCYLGPACSRSAWFRSAEAQNVTSVEALPPAILLDDQRRLPEWYWRTEGTLQCLDTRTLQFESNAFQRLRRDLKLLRRWTMEDNGELVLDEVIDGQGHISVRSRLCLGDGPWESTLEAAGGRWLLRRKQVGGTALRLALTLPAGLTPTVEQGQFTPEYGVEHPAQILVWAGRTALPCNWTLRTEFDSACEPAKGI